MEETIKVLIYIHAAFGGISLLAGLISMIAKKGLAVHKKSGLVFYYAMLMTAISAMVVAFLPSHESPFLFAVGIFSLYFVLTGKRALKFKHKNPSLHIDKWISRIMITAGVLMILLPIIATERFNIVLCVFAVVGIVFSIRDLMLFQKPTTLKKKWLKLHLGKMIGAYIAATTAFVVVNEFFPGIYGWFIPGIVGSFFITFWIRKVSRK